MAGQTTNIMLLADATTTVAPAATAKPAVTTSTAPAEAPIGFPPFDASTFASQILWLVICFGALYLIISRVAIPRIGGIIDTRRDKIEGDLAEADRLRQETDKAIADYEAALAAARQKAHGIAEETRAGVKADLDAKRAKVEGELAQKVSAAEAGIQSSKQEALGHVDEIAADTAAALVTRLTGSVTAEAARAAVASLVKR
jgi:F-type H+-transporting ATPase subunit b